MDNEKELFSWNPVYNFVMKVKHDYAARFGEPHYCDCYIMTESGDIPCTCLEYWIEVLQNPEYKERIKFLEMNQENELLLIRYANYSDVLGGGFDVTLDEVWNMYDGFYTECRSIVIDLANEEIALCPFKKFRNFNECAENTFESIIKEINNAKEVEISNKLDGSMQSARFYGGKILMAGSQSINSSKSWRLDDGYKMMMANQNYQRLLRDYPDYTFIFEYISLADAHVVKYKKEDEGLYLIGMRNVYTGKQESYQQILKLAEQYRVKSTVVYDKSFEQILEDCKTIKSEEQEGFVVNIDGRLMKVKGDDYVQIHKILSKISSINLILRSIADGTIDDLKSKIPTAYMNRVTVIEGICRNYVKEQKANVDKYLLLAPKDNKKDFMIWVTENVPKKYRAYVRNEYLGIKNNYLKSRGNSESPHYVRLVDMGIKREDYKNLFVEE